jgi:cytochrome c oxidase cbb3-type subunit 3
MANMVSVGRASWRCAPVGGRCIFISAFCAISFFWWNGKAPVFHAQQTNQAVNTGSDHKTVSDVGRRLFESTCAGCHGLDGRGGEKGPNIATRPETSRRSDDEILAILRHGVPAGGMPAFSTLGDVQLQAVMRHLRSLQGLTAKTVAAGNAEEGRKLFFREGACATCHMINRAGGFLGSDLSNYGVITSVAEMREEIMNHDELPHARTIVVSTGDGRKLSGFARNEDNFSLQLQTLDGNFHFLDKSTVITVDYSPAGTAMHAGKKLSTSDLDAIISYLVSVARSSQDGVKLKTLRRHHEEDEN